MYVLMNGLNTLLAQLDRALFTTVELAFVNKISRLLN